MNYALTAAGVERLADAGRSNQDTLHIDSMVVSSAALATMRDEGRYSVVGDSDALTFGAGDDFAKFPTAMSHIPA